MTSSVSSRAWEVILQESEDQSVIHSLRFLFPENDGFDEMHLSQLHKIVLGISHTDLSNELALPRTNIDATDSRGGTALSWAVRRGDIESTKILLNWNASPETRDYLGQSALCHAVQSPNSPALKLLLAGANIDQTTNSKRGMLHMTIQSQDNPTILKALIAKGADLNLQDCWGATPLQAAVARNRVLSIKGLLDHKASISVADKDGDTPLLQSVISSSHLVTEE